MTAVPAIEVRNLRRVFRVRQGLFAEPRQVVAVDDVTFGVPTGSVLGVVGESGCGKSTLARLILGLLPPSSGDVLVDGKRLADLDRRARPRFNWSSQHLSAPIAAPHQGPRRASSSRASYAAWR